MWILGRDDEALQAANSSEQGNRDRNTHGQLRQGLVQVVNILGRPISQEHDDIPFQNAGLVGWAGPDRAELAVALRCALVRGPHARLFVGAGIVEGSSAAAEWDETELKAQALLDALGVEP